MNALGFAEHAVVAMRRHLAGHDAGTRALRLRRALRTAARAPFYADMLAGVDLDAPDFSLSQLPVTNKAIVRRNFDRCVSDPRISRRALDEYFSERFDLGRRFQGRYLAFHTSGSTGVPSYVVWSERELGIATCMWFTAELEQARSVRDLRARLPDRPRRIAYVGILDDYVGGNSWAHNLRHVAKVGMFSIFEESSKAERRIEAFRPDAIISKPHVIARLAKRHARGELDLGAVRRAFTVGQNLSRAEIEDIRAGFGVVPRNSYSTCETGPIAKQVTDDPVLQIFGSRVVCELLDEAGVPIEEPEVVGRVVVTSLYNTVMPVIRYEVGDLASYAADEDGELGSLRYVHGRSTADIRFRHGEDELLVPEHLLWDLHVPGVDRYQVVQRGDLEIEVRVQLRDPGNAASIFESLGTKLRRAVGTRSWSDRIEVGFRAVDDVPVDASGKVRITVPLRERGTEP